MAKGPEQGGLEQGGLEQGGPEQGEPAQASFEDAFVTLRETVQALEAGNLPLAEATRLYEEGMRLAKACNELLTGAELKITKLQQDYAAEAARVAPADEFPEPDSLDVTDDLGDPEP